MERLQLQVQGPAPSAKPRPFDQRSQPSRSALLHAAWSQSSRLSQAERWARSCAGAKHRARRRIPQRRAQGYVAGGSTEAAGRSCTYPSLSISLLRGASAGTMLKKFDKKDEESGEGSLKAWGGQILAQIPGTFMGALFRATVRTRAGAQKGQGLVRRSLAVLQGDMLFALASFGQDCCVTLCGSRSSLGLSFSI